MALGGSRQQRCSTSDRATPGIPGRNSTSIAFRSRPVATDYGTLISTNETSSSLNPWDTMEAE
jgi:hypothetical protein